MGWPKGKKRPFKKRPFQGDINRKRKGKKRPDISGEFHPMHNPEVALKVSKTLTGRKRPEISGDNSSNKRPDVVEKQRTAENKHHIYLDKNSPTMLLSKRRHLQIHQKAYLYILEEFGKEGIDKYLDWFLKKF